MAEDMQKAEAKQWVKSLRQKYGAAVNYHVMSDIDKIIYSNAEKYMLQLTERKIVIKNGGKYCGEKITRF